LQFLRNGVPLRKQPLLIPPGPLQLRISREGDLLTLQVNDLPVLQYRDVFPLSGTHAGVFALMLPAKAGVARLRGWRKRAGTSPLEQGDAWYTAGQFAQALEFFQQQALATASTSIGIEARCKAGLCLAAMNRTDEAAELLSRVAAQEGNRRDDRWPLVAAVHLWLLKVRSKHWDEAIEVFDMVENRFVIENHRGFEDIAALIPPASAYQFKATYHPHQLFLTDVKDLKKIQQTLKILPFLAMPVMDLSTHKLGLIRTYWMLNRPAEALQASEEWLIELEGLPREPNSPHSW
jgi:tetratricopeptide (TPR) repeat protein